MKEKQASKISKGSRYSVGCALVDRGQALFSIDARLSLRPILLCIHSKYNGWNVEVPENRVDNTDLLRF